MAGQTMVRLFGWRCVFAFLLAPNSCEALHLVEFASGGHGYEHPDKGVPAADRSAASPPEDNDGEESQIHSTAGFSRQCQSGNPYARMSTAMQKLANSSWASLPPRAVRQAPVKVAFLIFARDRIHNADVWTSWLERARLDGLPFTIHVHAFGVNSTNSFHTPAFEQYVVPDRPKTRWCKMWPAEYSLFERALGDARVTHIMTISQDAVPVKPMQYMYEELRRSPLTRMCGDDNWYKPWPRAETWWLMRRGDAELFHENVDYVKAHFLGGSQHCTEESAWYYPLRVRMDRWGEQAAISKECVVFTDWRDGARACKSWAEVDSCNCDHLRASIAREDEQKWGASSKHPVTFTQVDRTSFQELLDSPFWFARKFSDGAITSEAAAMLNAYH